jgi:hypothetical protein
LTGETNVDRQQAVQNACATEDASSKQFNHHRAANKKRASRFREKPAS